MKTQVYACYLPGSESPDYIGSHKTEAPERNSALKWKYANRRYLGQGTWISPENGEILGMPKLNAQTPWGLRLLSMSPEERKAIRIETLAVVDTLDRWKAEAQAVRDYRPPFNVMIPATAEVKRRKWNAYHAAYSKVYYQRNPDKAAAKRGKDKLRARARRAERKAAKEAVA